MVILQKVMDEIDTDMKKARIKQEEEYKKIDM